MTLTKTQKEIIRLMREGWIMRDYIYNSTIRVQDDINRLDFAVSKKDFKILTKSGIVESKVRYGELTWAELVDFVDNYIDYTLTKKGRTVNID